MSRRALRRLEQFAWNDADVGVECLACGRAAVYCAWEAEKSFHERGWSTDVDEAVRRFRCTCGSRDLRLHPVPIQQRPKPIPRRPAALRPIYAEPWRSLARRPPTPFPDAVAIDAALATLQLAIDTRRYRGEIPPDEAVDAALALLRPHCYRIEDVARFVAELGRFGVIGWQPDVLLTGIRRQLGRRE